MNRPKIANSAYRFEDQLCEFENQWSPSLEINLADFLPDKEHPEFLSFLTELIRVDMELAFGTGLNRLAAEYFARYPELDHHQLAKSAIAFEEFRLRNINQEKIPPEVIASRYDVSILDWPEVEFENGVSTTIRSAQAELKLNRGTLPAPGDKFEEFRIIGRLGEGAYGTVMLAQQDDLAGRLMVLKFVPAVSQEDSFLARLQHTNIVPVYSIHGNDCFKAICMPFMGVATLQDLNRGLVGTDNQHLRQSTGSMALVRTVNRTKEQTVEKEIPNAADQEVFRHRLRTKTIGDSRTESSDFLPFVSRLMASVAEGLGYAHDRGIVHGDLKPANVLLDDDGNPILLDFHLANSKSESLGSHVGGTLAYMAPEHLEALNRNQRVDRRTDIYSAGVMLFELATGKLPFELPENLEQMKQARLSNPVFEKSVHQELGPDLISIITKCLDSDPRNRYQNGYELAEDLNATQQDLPLLHAKETSLIHRLKKWSRRHPRLTSISTIVTASAMVTILLLSWLWNLNHQLSVADAEAESKNFNAAAIRAKLPLTSWVLNDDRHFDAAIGSAREVLKRGGWDENIDPDRSRLALLNTQLAESERRAAGELNFWIAEGYLRLATTSVDDAAKQNQLHASAKHNQIAKEILAGSHSIGLDAQSAKIEAWHRGESFDFSPDWSELQDTGRIDRFMYAFLGRRDATNALREFNALVEEDPLDVMAWTQLGQIYFNMNRHELAQACFTICIGLEPENSYPRLYRAMSIIKSNRGQIDKAIEDLLVADRFSPNHLVVIQNLGLAYGMSRDFENAKIYLDKAIELGTHETRTWFLRSNVHRQLGNKEAAAEDMQYFLETEPQDYRSWRERGTQKSRTHPQQAAEDLEKAVEMNPNDVVAWNNLAAIYSSKLDDLAKAINAMDRVVLLQPENVKFRAGRGVLLARVGERSKAISDAQQCLKKSRSAATLYQVAGIYAQTSKLESADIKIALDLLKQAVRRSPELVAQMMKSDPDIVAVREHTEFKNTVDLLQNMGFDEIK